MNERQLGTIWEIELVILRSFLKIVSLVYLTDILSGFRVCLYVQGGGRVAHSPAHVLVRHSARCLRWGALSGAEGSRFCRRKAKAFGVSLQYPELHIFEGFFTGSFNLLDIDYFRLEVCTESLVPCVWY
jgi:hypothetical protein